MWKKVAIILVVVLKIKSLSCQDSAIDETDNEFKLNKGQDLAVQYCECKSTQRNKKFSKFHMDKCLQRKSKVYSEVCTNTRTIKNKRCHHFKQKVKNVCSTLEERSMTNYRVCRFNTGKFRLFHKKKSLCCNGTVIKSKVEEHQCCGNFIINTTLENCCHGNKFPRKSPTEMCCGDTVYNTDTHFCYKNQVFVASKISNHTKKPFVQEEIKTEAPSINFASIDRETRKDNGKSTKPPYTLTSIVLFLVVISITAIGLVIYRYNHQHPCFQKKICKTCISDSALGPENIRDDVYTAPVSRMDYNNTAVIHIESPFEDNHVTPLNNTPTETSHVQGSSSSETNEMVGAIEGDVCSKVSKCSKACSSKRHSQGKDSWYSTITLNMSDYINNLMKDDAGVKNENFVQNLVKEASTQTCRPKETNRRDMFGKPFVLSCFCTMDKPTVQLENSDAKMTISAKDLKSRSIEVHASSHTDLSEIKNKLDIGDEYHVISPCVEYDLPAIEKLEDHAVTELKLAGGRMDQDGRVDQIKIWRIAFDKNGNSSFEKFEVPVVQNHQKHLDTYSIIKNNMAYVFSRVFSTIVCTRHNSGEPREIDLWGVLYAKMTIEPIRATITLYVLDVLYIDITDYKKRLDKEELEYDKLRIDHSRIDLPGEVTGQDKLIVRLSIGDRDNWDFLRDPHNEDDSIQYDIFEYSICKVCCQQRSPESNKSTWTMANKGNQKPDILTGHLYVKTENQPSNKPVFTVDEKVPHVWRINSSVPNDYII